MNHTPPNATDGGDANTYAPDGRGDADANPYLARQDPRETPDLDAAAPTLTATELRQLNRKALVLLIGIVALLMVLASWLMHSLSTRGGSAKAGTKPATQVIETPDLPQPAPLAPPVPATASAPIPVMDNAPPLPPADPPHGDAGRDSVGDAMVNVAPAAPRGPSLAERRMANGAGADLQAAGQGGEGGTPGPGLPGQSAQGAAVAQAADPETSATFLHAPDALLVRGTYIRCVLETRIDTDLSGFSSCVVSEPVYSINGRRLLLPQGSRLLGRYDRGGTAHDRVAVVWDRITTPNGFDVRMASPGVDNLGSAGHVGQYSAHWPSRIASAVLISMISDVFKYAGEKYGPRSVVGYPGTGTVVDQPFQSNTAQTIESMAQQAIQSSANRAPTVVINQGTVVNVYVAQDVDFSGVLAGR